MDGCDTTLLGQSIDIDVDGSVVCHFKTKQERCITKAATAMAYMDHWTSYHIYVDAHNAAQLLVWNGDGDVTITQSSNVVLPPLCQPYSICGHELYYAPSAAPGLAGTYNVLLESEVEAGDARFELGAA